MVVLPVNNTTTTTNNVDILRKEYDKLNNSRKNYARANFIFDLNDADSTYLKLSIQTEQAFRELKKAELSEFEFNKLYAPVINYRIQSLESRLKNLKWKTRRGARI